MRPVHLVLAISLFSEVLYSQGNYYHVSLNSTVDTANQSVASVIRLWEQYLNSRPDSTYANPHWSEAEEQQYSPFDFVGHTYYTPSLYFFVNRFKNKVLSVSHIDSAFVLRTMFYTLDRKDSSQVSVAFIIQVAARRENGLLKLCNVLPINTRFWHREQVGNIRFIFPPEHVLNRALAGRMSAFVDSLATVWKVKLTPIEYYFADYVDRVAKAIGFDYWAAEGVSGPGGFVDSHNRIIYAGGSDEWYPHEFVHIIVNPLYPNINPYFAEGYATLVGGSAGHSLLWHIRRNYDYLKDHPDVDILSFDGVDAHVYPQYFIGGMICKMAEEKGGLPLIQKLMTYGPKDDDLYKAIKDVFGVEKTDMNKFLKAKLAQYATGE
jgi:hypothetical protein